MIFCSFSILANQGLVIAFNLEEWIRLTVWNIGKFFISVLHGGKSCGTRKEKLIFTDECANDQTVLCYSCHKITDLSD